MPPTGEETMSDEKKPDATFDPAGIVEKAFLLGLGVLETTKEKTGELANDLIEKGKVSQGDAKKVADKITVIAEEQQETFRKTVATETAKAVKATGGVTREDYDKLQAELAEIKALLSEKSGKPAAAPAPKAPEAPTDL
jgi:polyhydroxyalkanoate synthesis regulator phasin